MAKRAAVLASIVGVLSFLAPVAARAATPGVSASAACLVVNGPSGLHLQVGYAPNGPGDCTQLP